jgi:diguanylate cyclase (GGDEF)-like protein/PAS domain S-box-containing protein
MPDDARTKERARWRLYVASSVAAYLLLLIYVALTRQTVLGPLCIVPVGLAAWAYGARGGLTLALALAPVHLALTYVVPSGEGLGVSIFINLVTACVGFAFGLLFDRLRVSLAYQKECEERYERAARGANDGLWEWELESGKTYYSERFCQMLGYARHQLGSEIAEWLSRVHPEDRKNLQHALDQHIQGATPRLEHEHRLCCADGSYLWVHVRGIASSLEGSRPTLLTGWTTDISARKSSEQELRFHAFRDPLTGLANRSLFTDRLHQALLRGRGRSETRIAMLLIDLDRFKRVNDSLGHSAGDGLLLAVAERLKACVRAEDTVARLGGDEFALLLADVVTIQDAIEVADRVRRALVEPIVIKGRAVASGCSIGIVVTSRGDTNPHDIVRDADTAMYRAKALGRGQWAMFDPSMRDRAVQRLTLENELRSGLAEGHIEIFYQPIVHSGGGFAGFEALPRWRHPRLGMLLPREFIELSEETGLIMDLGDLVLGEACEMGTYVAGRLPHVPWNVHVNLSPKQIRRPDLMGRIEVILDTAGLDPARLCVEVTEDVILEEASAGSVLFERLRKKGVKVCMDDFGTGYSSLSYLHRFRVDFLKVETAFVHGAETREGGVQIVRSLVNLAKNLGVTAIAEGVETTRQWEVLRELGCPRAQGFFFAEPLSARELREWVEEHVAECA